MNETYTDGSESITAEQKRAAIEAVLRSNTFARSDQLKSFLKYVGEMEIAGRGSELTEYLIGVEALGRPSKYSPGDDSAVRNRAFALRKKLQEYYEHEKTDATIRIEMVKGSYCPHFVIHLPGERPNGNGASHTSSPPSEQLVTVGQLQELPVAPAARIKAVERNRTWRGFAAGVIVTALIAGAIYLVTGAKRVSSPTLPSLVPILSEAWGPILAPNADVLICVANPPSFSVHPGTVANPAAASATPSFNDPHGRPMPRELVDWYKQRYPAAEGNSQFLTITTNATYWGDSLGAMTALKTITAAGVIPQMFPEKVISMPTLRRRNVVLFGSPEYSPAITHFLEKCPLTVKYLDSVVSRDSGQTATRLYSHKRDAANRMTQVYGLITVLPGESANGRQHRTLIFSGINSAGTQAAAEFFSSPESLAELRKHLHREGHGSLPAAYQVVVSAETDDSILLNFKYETHRLLPL